MNPLDVKKLANEAHEMGLGNFVISGGEPLTYKAFDEVIKAIGPERFYIGFDTNAWFLTPEKARHLKAIGVEFFDGSKELHSSKVSTILRSPVKLRI
jgi:MoaA/NifB/PqqE/SkfB family radical SAM enzyme